MPAHIDHQHIERHIVGFEAVHQRVELLIAVRPEARPPASESEARRQRNASRDLHKVAEGSLVVVPVAKEVEILTLACGPRQSPRPGAGLSALEAEIVRVEERTRGVVHHRPAIAREDSPLNRRFRLFALGSVQRLGRAQQIPFIRKARMPRRSRPIQGKGDVQALLRKPPAVRLGGVVDQVERIGMDRQSPGPGVCLLEIRNRHPAVDDDHRRPILERAIRRPLHADHLRRKHGKARVAVCHRGSRIGGSQGRRRRNRLCPETRSATGCNRTSQQQIDGTQIRENPHTARIIHQRRKPDGNASIFSANRRRLASFRQLTNKDAHAASSNLPHRPCLRALRPASARAAHRRPQDARIRRGLRHRRRKAGHRL